MITLRRIGVFSAARVGFIFGLASGIFYLVVGITMFIISGGSLTDLPPGIWGFIAFNILISSLMLGGVVLMFAFLYNTGLGGLKLEFDSGASYVEKRKNDHSIDDVEEIE